MKLPRLLTILVLAASATIAGKLPPPGLTVSCESGSSAVGGNCLAGFIGFSGTGYPSHVRVVVTGTNVQIDDSVFSAPGGNLNFTEQLEPADTYTVTLYDTRGKVDTVIDQITVVTE